MSHSIKVIIAPDGSINLEINGIKGSSCLDITKKLEEALGTVEKREKSQSSTSKQVKRSFLIAVDSDGIVVIPHLADEFLPLYYELSGIPIEKQSLENRPLCG